MSTRSRYYPNLYKDSVSLMTLSAKITAVTGLEAASVVMASATNVENLARRGSASSRSAPTTSSSRCPAARRPARGAAKGRRIAHGEGSVREEAAAAEQPRDQHPDGGCTGSGTQLRADFGARRLRGRGGDEGAAARHARHAFQRQRAARERARDEDLREDHDLMVMGPDCGTAIVNGVPLGFANVVRRGPIGVVGASGTGTQEVTVRIHQLGAGVSQALGTGGHDLSELIGGISMLYGLRALDADPATKVIVLVSKPPAPDIAARVLAIAEASAKPVVVIFLGGDPATVTRNGVYGASYLAQAADMAVALSKGGEAAATPVSISNDSGARLAVWRARWHRSSVMSAASSLAARSVSKRSSFTPPQAYAPPPTRRLPAIGHSRTTGRARRIRSSTWAMTNSPRAVRTR